MSTLKKQKTTSDKVKKSHTLQMRVILLVVVIIFVIVLLMQFMKSRGAAHYFANLPEPIYPVKVIEVQPQDWQPMLGTTGLVRPNQGAMLHSQVPGVVKAIEMTAGQRVKKGDLLVEFDSRVELASLKAMEAKLPLIKQTYSRYLSLAKSQSVSKTELENAQANLVSLQADIDSLKATIERRHIYAPFDGIVGIVKVNVGQFLPAGTEIVRVEDASVMKVDFSIGESQVALLHVGQKIVATTDAYPNETFVGEIVAIEPAINPTNGLIDVQAQLKSPTENNADTKQKLLAGMFVHVEVALTKQMNQVVIPQVAINYKMYGETLYRLSPLTDEEKAHLASQGNTETLYRAYNINVTTLDRHGIYAQLEASSFKKGDRIVTAGMQNLSNGSLVRVVDRLAIGTQEPTKKTKL